MRKANKQKELEVKLNNILRQEWNPIGGNDIPSDEYINYVPRIYQLLSENCDAFFLTQMLMHISENVIGLKSDWYKTLKIAESIIIQLQKEIIEVKELFYQNKMRSMARKKGRKTLKKDYKFLMFYGDKEIGDPYKS